MANDHAQDRYDPPGVGSDFEQQVYGDVVKGEIFRICLLYTSDAADE